MLVFLVLGCRHEEPASATEAAQEPQAVVSYPSQPVSPAAKLCFHEDLRIHREGWWPQGVLLDSEGRILIPTYRENKIYIYDPSGQEAGVMEFPVGQGPGEFSSMDPQLSADGELVVYDRLQRRLTILGLPGRSVKKVMSFGEMRWVFSLGPGGDHYFWIVRFRAGSKEIQDLVLSRFDSGGQPVGVYESCVYAPVKTERSGKRVYGLYAPYGIYKLGPDGRLYTAASDHYEIRIYSAEGPLECRIIHKANAREPDETDLLNIQPYFSGFPAERTKLVPPARMPAIADILILPDLSILAVTFYPSGDPGTLCADWFSPEGRFLGQQRIPKYYQWFKAFGPAKSHAAIHGEHFYDIEPTNEAEDDFVVKRYTIRREST